ncbi:MAG: GNAT family N-acetyltransferase [Pseudomonadota bacterium]
MTSEWRLRDALPADQEPIEALMPLLVDFEVPERSGNPDDLWAGDVLLLRRHFSAEADNLFVLVAVQAERVIGFAMTSLREDPISKQPGAHLEAIAVVASAQGHGVGRALIRASEQRAAERGALTITLHAFRRNVRARKLYESEGYDAELYRYAKSLTM